MRLVVLWLPIFWDQQDKLSFESFQECKFCRGRGHSSNNKLNRHDLSDYVQE
jgi:hypothetical protein